MKTPFADTLRIAIQSCNQKATEEFLTLLKSEKKIPRKEQNSLHEALLFCLAYTPSEKCTALAGDLLRQTTISTDESGAQGGTVISSYTLSLTRHIAQHYPNAITFHSFDEEKTDAGELMKLILPSAEAEVLMSGLNKTQLFKKLCGGKITLTNVLNLFCNNAPEKLNEYVFSQLKLYVQIVFTNETISRTTARSADYKPFFHQEILKKPDSKKIISSPLPKAVRLTGMQQEQLAHHARMQLAAMGRETDPVTFSFDQDTEFFVLDRGFSIALFSLRPENRLAFDSYIGYMMFKNGLPVAYGGAWIFFQRALIGINIFDAYRGGESAFLFAQLLRVYHQRYKIKRFSVEPYQYGKDNPEGIASGAYWFYYRFGFRSDDAALRELATEEEKKIRSLVSYKTPADTLRKFTKSNITCFIDEGDNSPDPAQLSLGITRMIAEKYKGNRALALQNAAKNFASLFGKNSFKPKTETEKQVFENWSLAILYFEKTKFTQKQKVNFIKALQEKSQYKESNYIHLLLSSLTFS